MTSAYWSVGSSLEVVEVVIAAFVLTASRASLARVSTPALVSAPADSPTSVPSPAALAPEAMIVRPAASRSARRREPGPRPGRDRSRGEGREGLVGAERER